MCYQAHLQLKQLFSPLKTGDFWADFNLNDETLTLNCQLICLRNERPNTDSEEYEQRITEILSIHFDNITEITEKYWGFRQRPKGSSFTFILRKPCNYIYSSSSEVVLSANKLSLNIMEGQEIQELLNILSKIFTTRLKRRQQRQVVVATQNDNSETEDSDYFPNPVPVRSTSSLSALSSFACSNLAENDNSQVSVGYEYKEKLSFIRSGSTFKRIHEIETEIPMFNSFGNELNSDNWAISNTSNNQILPQNQNLNKSRLSLMSANGKDENMTENSQENKSRTINTLEEKLNRTMDKYNPKQYRSEISTSVLDNIRYHSNKENQPDNISQNRSACYTSAASGVPSTAMNHPHKSKKEQKVIIDTIDLVSSDSDETTPAVATMKPNNNSLPHVNNRLKKILVQSDDDNELELCIHSDIIAGNLRNIRSRSLLRRSLILEQETQDSTMEFKQNIIISNRSNTGPKRRPQEPITEKQTHINRSVLNRSLKRQDSQDSSMEFQQKVIVHKRNNTETLRELFAKKQSKMSHETVSSDAEFQQKIPRTTSNNSMETLLEYQPEKTTTQSQNVVIDLTQDSSSVDFQTRVTKRSRPIENSQNEEPIQKPKHDNSCHKLSPTDPNEMYEKHNLNNTADVILDRVLSNVELPHCQTFNFTPTSQCNITDRQISPPTSKASHNSAECDVLSAQNPSTPETADSVSQQPLNEGTQDSMNNSPTIITPLSEISIRSARSCVSVSPSSQTDNINNNNVYKLEEFARRLNTEFDKIRNDYPMTSSNVDNNENDDDDDTLVIDLDNDPENLNDEHDRDETINTTVDVQPVRRKRGRPRKSNAPEINANETLNTTACSTTSSKRRKKKSKRLCECDTELADDLNYSRIAINNLTDAQKEEEERKRLLRFSTRTRFTKPPVRLVDELNETYLEKVQGQIQRKRESGYCTDTIVYRKSLKRRTQHTAADLSRLSQTLNALDITENLNDTEFESVVHERRTQSDLEHSDKHKKKKSKRLRTEYDSSLIEDMSSIRLRLSRRNDTTFDLLTQESVTQDAVLPSSQSQESQGWGAIFNKTRLKQPEAICNNTNTTDASDLKEFDDFMHGLTWYKNLDKYIEGIAKWDPDLQKAAVEQLYKDASKFTIGEKYIKEELRRRFGHIISSLSLF